MAMALLAHLACGKGIWGPRLIVVPTRLQVSSLTGKQSFLNGVLPSRL